MAINKESITALFEKTTFTEMLTMFLTNKTMDVDGNQIWPESMEVRGLCYKFNLAIGMESNDRGWWQKLGVLKVDYIVEEQLLQKVRSDLWKTLK